MAYLMNESASSSPDAAFRARRRRPMLAQFRLPPNYIFYPAQFWTHKNHVRILRAILHLKQKYNLRLPVVFAGSDQGNESYISGNWCKRCSWTIKIGRASCRERV